MKLDQETLQWYEVHGYYVHEKVSHALRSARKPQQPRTEKPTRPKMRTIDEAMIANTTMTREAAFDRLVTAQAEIFKKLAASKTGLPQGIL
jgi:hypothetical protein